MDVTVFVFTATYFNFLKSFEMNSFFCRIIWLFFVDEKYSFFSFSVFIRKKPFLFFNFPFTNCFKLAEIYFF